MIQDKRSDSGAVTVQFTMVINHDQVPSLGTVIVTQLLCTLSCHRFQRFFHYALRVAEPAPLVPSSAHCDALYAAALYLYKFAYGSPKRIELEGAQPEKMMREICSYECKESSLLVAPLVPQQKVGSLPHDDRLLLVQRDGPIAILCGPRLRTIVREACVVRTIYFMEYCRPGLLGS
eukprot:g3541.t1